MLTVMDLVVPHNRTTIGPDLDSCQGVAIDVVSFNEASAITENVDTTLVSVKNGVTPVFRNKKKYIGAFMKKYFKGELLHGRQSNPTDLIVGSLFEVIHTPAKLFA